MRLKHRDVTGRIFYEDDVFWAETMNTHSELITHGESLNEVIKQFKLLVDGYIDICKVHGVKLFKQTTEDNKE